MTDNEIIEEIHKILSPHVQERGENNWDTELERTMNLIGFHSEGIPPCTNKDYCRWVIDRVREDLKNPHLNPWWRNHMEEKIENYRNHKGE